MFIQIINSFDWLRFFNVALSVAALFLLVTRVFRRRHHYAPRLRLLIGAMGAYMFTAIVASIENVMQNNPGGIREFMFAFAGTLVIIALTVAPERLEK
jgi:ABC-type Fe3+-siderophore transport system permease subunit